MFNFVQHYNFFFNCKLPQNIVRFNFIYMHRFSLVYKYFTLGIIVTI